MKEFSFAIKQTVPIFFTYIFIGIAFGMLMTEAGYSPVTSLISSIFIYAGSMQIAMVPLLRSGASLMMLALMTLFINGRHLFYGVGFIDKFRHMGAGYPYMVMSLTDETYSCLCSLDCPPGMDANLVSFFISLSNHCYWIAGTMLGSVAGTLLPFDLKGIDFSATAFFLVVVIDKLRVKSTHIPALIAFCTGILCLCILGPEFFIIPALAITLILLIVFRDFCTKEETDND